MRKMLNRRLWILCGGLVLVGLVAVFMRSQGEDALRHVAVPAGGISPDLAVGADRLHIVYGRKGNVYYASSADGGRTFSEPVRVAGGKSSATVGHERGPRIALGKDGTIHVVWLGSQGVEVFYARSTDGGQHFSEPRNLAAEARGADGASVAADDTGKVYVVWLGGGEGPDSPASSLLQLAYSSDNGSTFASAQTVRSNFPGGACACCALKAVMAPDHRLLVGFRGAYRSIRDMYLLEATSGGDPFQAVRISDDGWRLDACPMAGPFLQATTSSKQILAAWMSQGEVYYAASSDAGKSFSRRVGPAEARRRPRTLPMILANAQGERLFAWVEGQSVHWERISREGRVLQSGENGRLPSDSKFAAYVDRDDSFALVY